MLLCPFPYLSSMARPSHLIDYYSVNFPESFSPRQCKTWRAARAGKRVIWMLPYVMHLSSPVALPLPFPSFPTKRLCVCVHVANARSSQTETYHLVLRSLYRVHMYLLWNMLPVRLIAKLCCIACRSLILTWHVQPQEANSPSPLH